MKRHLQYRHLLARLLWWDALPLVLTGALFAIVTALGVVAGALGAALL